MKRLIPFLALLAVAACAPSAPPMPASDPAAGGGTVAAPAGTAPPPSLGPSVLVQQTEDWANKVCACPDIACTKTARLPEGEAMTDMASRLEFQRNIGRVMQAQARGNACVQKLSQ